MDDETIESIEYLNHGIHIKSQRDLILTVFKWNMTPGEDFEIVLDIDDLKALIAEAESMGDDDAN